MIVDTLKRQTKQIFVTLLASIEKCPEGNLGLNATTLHDSIGKIAMHIGGSIEGTFMTAAFREKWDTPVQTKQECIAYLESCRDDLLLPFIQNEDLATTDAQPEYFISKLDRVMKILRHIAHHSGEIGCHLRQMGFDEANFIL